MTTTAGIDIGASYTKVIIARDGDVILGKSIIRTGYKPSDAAEEALELALADAKVDRSQVDYIVATGYGRFQVPFAQATVTELTAASWGCLSLFPGTRTILDVGGQSVKASRIDETGKVKSFRLNEKCAAGTGAFLEKTARYMGFDTEEIGPLAATSNEAVAISGVCTVFAEAEVINHLSQGIPPADIMHGAIISLVGKSVQLMKRAKMEPEYTLIGGIMRYPTMAKAVREQLKLDVNVPEGDTVQAVGALGAAILAARQARKIAAGTAISNSAASAMAGSAKP